MSESVLLNLVRFAAVVVVAVAAWSVWVRRLTFGSRYDADGTVAVALFGIGTALSAPWAVPVRLWGRYYLLDLCGHLCYLVGAALVVKVVYQRLLPDDALAPFLRRWVWPLVAVASSIMAVSFVASPATTVPSAYSLYFATPDWWLKVYAVAHLGAELILGVTAAYGVSRMFPDPRAVRLRLTFATLAVAALAGGLLGCWSIVSGASETLQLALWLGTYAAFAGALAASALQWKFRMRSMTRPECDGPSSD